MKVSEIFARGGGDCGYGGDCGDYNEHAFYRGDFGHYDYGSFGPPPQRPRLGFRHRHHHGGLLGI